MENLSDDLLLYKEILGQFFIKISEKINSKKNIELSEYLERHYSIINNRFLIFILL